jgi:hypothetical protein
MIKNAFRRQQSIAIKGHGFFFSFSYSELDANSTSLTYYLSDYLIPLRLSLLICKMGILMSLLEC